MTQHDGAWQLTDVIQELEQLRRDRARLLAERNAWIVILHQNGWSFARIGRLARLTKSSIAKIWDGRPES